jgi:bacteriophage HK97-gp10 putative tail-component
MSDTVFQLNYEGITELMKSDELKADMLERVERVKEVAKGHAPVVTGEYRDSIDAGVFDDGDRTTGYVHSSVDYACAVESRHRTLGVSLEAG